MQGQALTSHVASACATYKLVFSSLCLPLGVGTSFFSLPVRLVQTTLTQCFFLFGVHPLKLFIDFYHHLIDHPCHHLAERRLPGVAAKELHRIWECSSAACDLVSLQQIDTCLLDTWAGKYLYSKKMSTYTPDKQDFRGDEYAPCSTLT